MGAAARPAGRTAWPSICSQGRLEADGLLGPGVSWDYEADGHPDHNWSCCVPAAQVAISSAMSMPCCVRVFRSQARWISSALSQADCRPWTGDAAVPVRR